MHAKGLTLFAMATALHRFFHRLRPQPLPALATGDMPTVASSPLQVLQQGLGEIKRYAVHLERPVSLPSVTHLPAHEEVPVTKSLAAPASSPAPLMLGASIAFIDEELKARGEHPLLREMKAQAQWFQHFQSQESYEYPEQRQSKEELAVHAPVTVLSPAPPAEPLSHLAIEALPPLLGHQRLTLTVTNSAALELKLCAQTPGVTLEIADMQPGRWQDNTLWVEAGSYEICFRMYSSQTRYATVEVRLATADENTLLAASTEAFPVQIQELAQPTHWIDHVPETWREVIHHIAAHGAIGEQALIQMLGGTGSGVRKARRFAAALPEWGHHLPFRLEIATTTDGREYRKVS